MSLHLPASSLQATSPAESDIDASSASSVTGSDYADEDNNFDDWVSDQMEAQPCRSLFEDKTLPSAGEALKYDEETYGFGLDAVCEKLALDAYGRIRLINFIRKTRPSAKDMQNLMGSEAFLSADEYLIPSVEDDPLLQPDPDSWSSDEDEAPLASSSFKAKSKAPADTPKDLPGALKRVRALEAKLSAARQDMADYRKLVAQRLDAARLADIAAEPGPSASGASVASVRDDDTHYFESYAANDIHAVMIQDKVRTSTYASFILQNPMLFRDAIVLDVGCGTGILSLFAARGGARHVYAVDASGVAEKAKAIVKENKLEDKITVIHGKVEDITLPNGVDKVDIIISEWMGYALLYESMLDSVLRARDRFLKPGGVLAPSQAHMALALCEGSEIWKERIGFWGDVYGFDLSEMAKCVYEDAVVDVVGPESIISAPCVVKDILISQITPAKLDFSAPFSLTCTSDRRTKIRALVLHFDIFFTTHGRPIPPGTQVHLIPEGEAALAEVWPVGGRPPQRRSSQGGGLKRRSSLAPVEGSLQFGGVDGEARVVVDEAEEKRKAEAAQREKEAARVTSFSTGPRSVPTHWKQTIFFLREPIVAGDGTIVRGTFSCKKADDNSRELDVEIHYAVQQPGEDAFGDVIVQMYKVR
ncbi:S-adenosyl-L-methionine-dependent methyltransferase [Coniophora puteana RWD-64-598 SS2]|uniref:type I protein arginine methyltransferase n=1 Tax=Coniophora puteana (strain RWD-64-598) TaxID=741705 RepID=A0A5M3MR63_CONPW|nr:S-adenosyl-L-methionine-dependent methyltransferase [Coniophora puteana RWD-64-598 SS2]EIW81556.1 S-adenosyl-L-methionine-dependent methyltransferase [Coniophora puteana RWD-64-598 SS2]